MIDVPVGGLVRLRILNLDNARIITAALPEQPASVIAIDGNPVAPVAFDEWQMGPAMRLDLALRAPDRGGATFALVEQLRRRALDARDLSRGWSGAVASAARSAAHCRRARSPAPISATRKRCSSRFSAASATALDPNDLPPALTALQSALGTNEPAAGSPLPPAADLLGDQQAALAGQAGGHCRRRSRP